ncbi:MAG TPA: hypothetical protein DCG49_12500 [Ruminococcus sp.]|nr:hypothetical protein [Ruminococcus sp.]
MDIFLHSGHSFPVPVTVADHFLGLASHDQLKVLLYVLCHADEPLSQEQIAKECKVLPSSVEEAIVFWQNANVLQQTASPAAVSLPAEPFAAEAPPPDITEERTVPVMPVTDLPQQTVPAAEQPAAAPNVPHVQNSSSFHVKPSEMAARLQNDKKLAELFQDAEQYAGRPLRHAEQQSLLWIHDYLGLAADLIHLIAAFCASTQKFNPRDLEHIAIEWQERGIQTPELAMQDIERRTNARSYTGQVMSVLQMPRFPTAKQQEFIDGWFRCGISPELVHFASEKTRDQTDDQMSFPYMNKILMSWAEAGVRNVADAQKLDEAYQAEKKKKKATGQSEKDSRRKPAASGGASADASFDLDDFDRLVNRF